MEISPYRFLSNLNIQLTDELESITLQEEAFWK